MRKYRQRSPEQAELVGNSDGGALDLGALFGGGPGTARLEIGFGHGRFLSQMAAAHPDERFIGVDYNDVRTTKTAHKSLLLDAANVRLFTDEAHHFVRFRLPEACLHRAYILFPDPWPKPHHRRRRLINRTFLVDLTRAVAPGGRLIVASDCHNYGFQALSNLTTIPGAWLNRYQPNGYRFDIPTPEGCSILYLMFERTCAAAPAPLPWPAEGPDGGGR
jgi:tRNA (guanine-N7-)-methyltransferase